MTHIDKLKEAVQGAEQAWNDRTATLQETERRLAREADTVAAWERRARIAETEVERLRAAQTEGSMSLRARHTEVVRELNKARAALPDTTKLDAAVWHATEYLEEGGVPETFSEDDPVTDQAAALLDELIRIAAVRADRLDRAALPVLPDVGPVTRDLDAYVVEGQSFSSDYDAARRRVEGQRLLRLAAHQFAVADHIDAEAVDEPCMSRGPRIGNDGVPYCKLPMGHNGRHAPAIEDGWDATVVWSDRA